MMTKTGAAAFPVSDNVAEMKASSTMAAMQAADAMRNAGVDVVDLGAGEPDFDTPDFIKEAAIAALKTAIFWDPKLIDAHILLGKIFLERGDREGGR